MAAAGIAAKLLVASLYALDNMAADRPPSSLNSEPP